MEVPLSPKVQAKDGAPSQLEGRAVAANTTARGAVPEAGVTEAEQARVQGSPTVMAPFWVQALPSAVTVRAQLKLPAEV